MQRPLCVCRVFILFLILGIAIPATVGAAPAPQFKALETHSRKTKTIIPAWMKRISDFFRLKRGPLELIFRCPDGSPATSANACGRCPDGSTFVDKDTQTTRCRCTDGRELNLDEICDPAAYALTQLDRLLSRERESWPHSYAIGLSFLLSDALRNAPFSEEERAIARENALFPAEPWQTAATVRAIVRKYLELTRNACSEREDRYESFYYWNERDAVLAQIMTIALLADDMPGDVAADVNDAELAAWLRDDAEERIALARRILDRMQQEPLTSLSDPDPGRELSLIAYGSWMGEVALPFANNEQLDLEENFEARAARIYDAFTAHRDSLGINDQRLVEHIGFLCRVYYERHHDLLVQDPYAFEALRLVVANDLTATYRRTSFQDDGLLAPSTIRAPSQLIAPNSRRRKQLIPTMRRVAKHLHAINIRPNRSMLISSRLPSPDARALWSDATKTFAEVGKGDASRFTPLLNGVFHATIVPKRFMPKRGEQIAADGVTATGLVFVKSTNRLEESLRYGLILRMADRVHIDTSLLGPQALEERASLSLLSEALGQAYEHLYNLIATPGVGMKEGPVSARDFLNGFLPLAPSLGNQILLPFDDAETIWTLLARAAANLEDIDARLLGEGDDPCPPETLAQTLHRAGALAERMNAWTTQEQWDRYDPSYWSAGGRGAADDATYPNGIWTRPLDDLWSERTADAPERPETCIAALEAECSDVGGNQPGSITYPNAPQPVAITAAELATAAASAEKCVFCGRGTDRFQSCEGGGEGRNWSDCHACDGDTGAYPELVIETDERGERRCIARCRCEESDVAFVDFTQDGSEAQCPQRGVTFQSRRDAIEEELQRGSTAIATAAMEAMSDETQTAIRDDVPSGRSEDQHAVLVGAGARAHILGEHGEDLPYAQYFVTEMTAALVEALALYQAYADNYDAYRIREDFIDTLRPGDEIDLPDDLLPAWRDDYQRRLDLAGEIVRLLSAGNHKEAVIHAYWLRMGRIENPVYEENGAVHLLPEARDYAQNLYEVFVEDLHPESPQLGDAPKNYYENSRDIWQENPYLFEAFRIAMSGESPFTTLPVIDVIDIDQPLPIQNPSSGGAAGGGAPCSNCYKPAPNILEDYRVIVGKACRLNVPLQLAAGDAQLLWKDICTQMNLLHYGYRAPMLDRVLFARDLESLGKADPDGTTLIKATYDYSRETDPKEKLRKRSNFRWVLSHELFHHLLDRTYGPVDMNSLLTMVEDVMLAEAFASSADKIFHYLALTKVPIDPDPEQPSQTRNLLDVIMSNGAPPTIWKILWAGLKDYAHMNNYELWQTFRSQAVETYKDVSIAAFKRAVERNQKKRAHIWNKNKDFALDRDFSETEWPYASYRCYRTDLKRLVAQSNNHPSDAYWRRHLNDLFYEDRHFRQYEFEHQSVRGRVQECPHSPDGKIWALMGTNCNICDDVPTGVRQKAVPIVLPTEDGTDELKQMCLCPDGSPVPPDGSCNGYLAVTARYKNGAERMYDVIYGGGCARERFVINGDSDEWLFGCNDSNDDGVLNRDEQCDRNLLDKMQNSGMMSPGGNFAFKEHYSDAISSYEYITDDGCPTEIHVDFKARCCPLLDHIAGMPVGGGRPTRRNCISEERVGMKSIAYDYRRRMDDTDKPPCGGPLPDHQTNLPDFIDKRCTTAGAETCLCEFEEMTCERQSDGQWEDCCVDPTMPSPLVTNEELDFRWWSCPDPTKVEQDSYYPNTLVECPLERFVCQDISSTTMAFVYRHRRLDPQDPANMSKAEPESLYHSSSSIRECSFTEAANAKDRTLCFENACKAVLHCLQSKALAAFDEGTTFLSKQEKEAIAECQGRFGGENGVCRDCTPGTIINAARENEEVKNCCPGVDPWRCP